MSLSGNAPVLAFVAATFRSVWSLELLLLLRADPQRAIGTDEIVRRLRASRLVVQQSLDDLGAAGLVLIEPDERVRFRRAEQDEALLVALEQLYRRSPDAVRRAIARGNPRSLSAFADAFRLRTKD